MRRILFFLLIATLAIGAGCSSSITVTSDYDKQVDFTQYKTFGFLPWSEESAKLINDIDQKRLETAVTNELTQRGFTRVDGIGDCMIGFHAVVETRTGTTSYTNYYGSMGYYGYGGFGYGYGYPYGGSASTTTSTYDYQVGTVIVDQFEVATKKLVWEGVAQGEVTGQKKNREENINYHIERMFANYRVKKKTTE